MSDSRYQVPHHTIGWLLLAAVWAVVPLLWGGSLPLLLVVLALLGWRWQVARGRLSMPGRWVKVLLLLLLVTLTLWHYHTLLGPDAGTSLLAACFVLKLLEMHRLRDAYVVLLLGYFVQAMLFLFRQELYVTLYVVLGFVLFTTALTGIQQREARPMTHLKRAAWMVGQAVPLMLVIFILVPRVAPLWGFTLHSDQARTGLADSMTPGDISDVAQSSDPVFRVEFTGEIPPPAQRYWRALTWSHFDGRQWSQESLAGVDEPQWIYYPGERQPAWLSTLERQREGLAPDYRYRVYMEPSGRRWLYALEVSFSSTQDVGMTPDYRLLSREPVTQPLAYQAESYAGLVKDGELSPLARRQNLSLPAGGNPEARSMALVWRAKAVSDPAYMEQVLNWFRTENFHYTLHPPKFEGVDGIDDFLFRDRRGFCAHYASAFAFLMRAAGIPARVVAGYQGGELSPLGHYLQVRQYDAHAWVEVWLEGEGWVQVDPTAAVSPARIDDGLIPALGDQTKPAGAAFGQWASGSLLARAGMLGDYVSYLWQRWVLSYDQSSQRNLFERWFSGITFMRTLLAAGLALLMLLGGLRMHGYWQRYRRTPPWQWQYQRLVRALQRRGVKVQDTDTPRQLLIKAGIALPAKRRAFTQWLLAYEALAYARGDQEQMATRLALLKQRWPFGIGKP